MSSRLPISARPGVKIVPCPDCLGKGSWFGTLSWTSGPSSKPEFHEYSRCEGEGQVEVDVTDLEEGSSDGI